MNWSAQITDKTAVTAEGFITYTFSILKDGVSVNTIICVTDKPETIQQEIEAKVKAFAAAYELAEELPAIGDVLEIITTE